jgi:hypothetical protein
MLHRDDLDLLLLTGIVFIILVLVGILELLAENLSARIVPTYALVSRRRSAPYRESLDPTQTEVVGTGGEQGA